LDAFVKTYNLPCYSYNFRFLGNDVAENPGPEIYVDEVSVFIGRLELLLDRNFIIYKI